jgi:hypothetical protein
MPHFLAPASELADTEKAPLAAQFRRDEEGQFGLPQGFCRLGRQ